MPMVDMSAGGCASSAHVGGVLFVGRTASPWYVHRTVALDDDGVVPPVFNVTATSDIQLTSPGSVASPFDSGTGGPAIGFPDASTAAS